MPELLLAFDFGGTKLMAALASSDFHPDHLHWLAKRQIFSPEGVDARYDLDTMISLGRELLGDQKPAAIGVSFGGPVDYETGTVRLSHHVPGWENTPLQAQLEAEFKTPVRVDNDANVAALGEYALGAGHGYDSMLYITVSTGVGGGWILNGRPWRGYQSMAGEIGHTVVDPNGPQCLCGKRGCVERLASGPYMAQGYQAQSRTENLGDVTGKQVAELAEQGDELARQILKRGAWGLGVAIGNAANLVNPQLFVLGGGVTRSGHFWWRTVRETAVATALPEIQFKIVPAKLGDDAPLWGGIHLANHLSRR